MSRNAPDVPLDATAAGTRTSRSVWHHRRATLLAWQIAGLVAAAAAIAALRHQLPSEVSWLIFVDTLAWSWVAALGSALLIDALVGRQPYLHFTVSLVSIAVTFGGLFVGLLATHAAYSRWAIVIGVICTLAMHAVAWQRWRRHTTMRFGVVDEALLARLAPASTFQSDAAAMARCTWTVLPEGGTPAGLDGVVLPDDASGRYRQGVALRAKLAGVQVYSESFVRSLLTGRLSLDKADAVFLDDVPSSVIYAGFKRGLDVVGALLVSPIALALILVALLLIRLESEGSALLVQPRMGLRGQIFGMLKLRTMLTSTGSGVHSGGSEARITRMGRWLRRTRMDELPQLWNVLRGEMSLIGPRPEWTETATALERQIPQFAFRYLVRPGITGWAQVHQGHVTAEEASRIKLEYDLYYAKNMSLALDLAILALTTRTVITGDRG